MFKNKLIQLINNFERKEMTRFREFACSPYFNKHEEVKALITYFSDIFPRCDKKHCDRYTIFQALFPGQQHDQQKLAVLFTYSMRLAEQFLCQEQFNHHHDYQERLLLQHLREKNQIQFFEKRLKSNEKATNLVQVRESQWYYNAYYLATEADNLFKLSGEGTRDDSLQRKQAFLDRFYLAETLKDACEMKVRSRMLKVHYHNALQDTIMTEVEQQYEHFGKEPLIAIYYHIYRMITSDDVQYYFNTLKTLEENQNYLPTEELRNTYNYLQNYCIKKINKGAPNFLGEIFKLYKAQLKRGLLYENGLLSEWHYKNIVTTGIRLEELEWVYEFIESYHKKISAGNRENAYRFNLASYYYAAGKFDEVLPLLTQVEYYDLRYNLGAKALLLRTYYDLEEYEALFSLTDSFKQYLSRNKLMADVRRQGYHNLFKLTRRAAFIRLNLTYSKPDKSQKELRKLKEDIAESDAIFNKSWLEEKVMKIEKELKK
ncbi:MAG: hypothetical protein MI974_16955 [Chitinophagales bacterium]|nr:hypothetical protein [Chitinophagales bacterium]